MCACQLRREPRNSKYKLSGIHEIDSDWRAESAVVVLVEVVHVHIVCHFAVGDKLVGEVAIDDMVEIRDPLSNERRTSAHSTNLAVSCDVLYRNGELETLSVQLRFGQLLNWYLTQEPKRYKYTKSAVNGAGVPRVSAAGHSDWAGTHMRSGTWFGMAISHH